MSHVVIVDDEKWWTDLYVKILEREGFSCNVAHSAAEAIEAIDQHLPAAIVLDFMMPQGNAMVLIHELQSYQDTAIIPVVLITSISEMQDMSEDVGEYGVRMVLNKSEITPRSVVKAVRAVII